MAVQHLRAGIIQPECTVMLVGHGGSTSKPNRRHEFAHGLHDGAGDVSTTKFDSTVLTWPPHAFARRHVLTGIGVKTRCCTTGLPVQHSAAQPQQQMQIKQRRNEEQKMGKALSRQCSLKHHLLGRVSVTMFHASAESLDHLSP